MNIEPENLPEEFFGWIETTDFVQLTSDQKAAVLAFITESEYNELRHTVVEIKAGLRHESQASEVLKDRLLERFDKLYPHAAHTKTEKIVRFWQAAAVALVLLSSVLTLLLARQKTTESTLALTKTDTLYLVKQVATAPQKVHDTIWIRLTEPKKAKATPKRNTPLVSDPVASDPLLFTALEETPVLPLRERGSQANGPKRNSMKDDSLLRRLSFVTL